MKCRSQELLIVGQEAIEFTLRPLSEIALRLNPCAMYVNDGFVT